MEISEKDLLRILSVYPLSSVGYLNVSCRQRDTSGSPLFQEAWKREQISLMSMSVCNALSEKFWNTEKSFPGFLVYDFVCTFRCIAARTHACLCLYIDTCLYINVLPFAGKWRTESIVLHLFSVSWWSSCVIDFLTKKVPTTINIFFSHFFQMLEQWLLHYQQSTVDAMQPRHLSTPWYSQFLFLCTSCLLSSCSTLQNPPSCLECFSHSSTQVPSHSQD